MPPEPATWRFGAAVTGARFHNEHLTTAFQDSSVHYWHVQAITIAQLHVTVARGLRPGIGIEAIVPLRVERSRIRYENLERQPYTLVYPDYHHRNETLVRFADPMLTVHVARAGDVWSIGGRAGLTIPSGKTEPNPFELGRLGLPHQHFQFGTGTWDPVFVLAAGRDVWGAVFTTTAFAQLTLAENSHGFQAGNRYNLNLAVARPLVGAWGGNVALHLTREQAERWSGRLEEEGNLGRTDALLSLGISRPVGRVGALALTLGIPVYSHVRGEQGEQPLILSFSWSL